MYLVAEVYLVNHQTLHRQFQFVLALVVDKDFMINFTIYYLISQAVTQTQTLLQLIHYCRGGKEEETLQKDNPLNTITLNTIYERSIILWRLPFL